MGQLAIEASVVSPLQELLESTRRPDLQKLASTLEDKKITQDEFVGALSSPKINKEQAVGLFTEVQKIFGPELTKEEVVPFWALFVDGQGLPKELKDLVRNTEWIPVHAERLQGVDGQEIGHVTIKRSIVPKGVIGPGFELNDGGLGAWRLVQRINADLVLDKSKFGLTDEELARMIAQVDLYAKALVLTKSGYKIASSQSTLSPQQKAVYSQLDCSALYYSHFDIPDYFLCDGFDVICMPLVTTPDGALVRQSRAIVLDWTTRMKSKGGNPVDLNVLADPNHPNCAGDTWGRWILYTKGNNVVINYDAILDVPGVLMGVTAGTGDGKGKLSKVGDGFVEGIIQDTTLGLLKDNIKLGLVFDQAKKALSAGDKTTPFQQTMNFVLSFYDKGVDLEKNLKALKKALAKK